MLIVAYVVYYLFNIIMDSLKSKNVSAATSGGDVLTFSEEVQTTPVEHEEERAIIPVAVLDEFEDDSQNAVWEREDEDTEELNIISHNINSSTGGITQMSEVIKLAKSNTIDYKRSIVF
ncbi:hypothetical protein [Pedobacter terrae]|uniref:hypothetical protein n=1 Tax=Pedobacter terrae TaxID=405671 RepID=UPI00115FF7B3|nr:hypothetical protein [Pedobacter terrae]